jgi:hypothetical protein
MSLLNAVPQQLMGAKTSFQQHKILNFQLKVQTLQNIIQGKVLLQVSTQHFSSKYKQLHTATKLHKNY